MTFGSPIWLYLIPPALAALVAVDVFARRARVRALERFAAPALLPGLLSAYSVGRARFKTALMALAVAALFVALARPQVGYEWSEVKAKGVDLVIAMDVSKSMLARDIKPDRLERAKLAVLDLIDKLKGDRIGLVAFSGEAFLQCPLTLDYDAFRQSLEALDTDVIPREGTDLGAAISEAVAAFDVTSNQKVVVLITDGEDLEGTGLAQAKKAAEKGVVIYTVGVGTPQGDLIPVRDAQGREDFLRDATNGKIVTTRLEDSTLVAVADAGHGFYTPLGPTGEGLWKVYESGWLKRPQEDLAARQQRMPIERFQWPLALSIFLFAWEPIVGTRKRFFLRLLRRRAPTALTLALALFAAADLRAQENPQSAYAQGEYEKAAAQWAKEGEARPDGRADFNQGASLYKLGDYAQAAKAFTAALGKQAPAAQKDTFFNLGNTRFMQGAPLEQSNAKDALALWEQALKDYDNALELAPKDADAAHNRAYVEKRIEALKKREEEKKKQQQQQQQQQNQQQNQNQQNQDQKNQDQQQQQSQQNQSQQNQQQNQSSQNDQNQKQDQNQNKDQQNQDQKNQDQQQKGQQGQDKQPQNQQPQDASQNKDQKQDKSSEENKDKQEQKDKQQGQSGESKQDEEKKKQDKEKSGQGESQKQAPKPEEKKNEPGKDDASANKDKQEQKEKEQPEGSGKDKPAQKPQPPRDTRGDSQQDAQEQRGPDNKGVAAAPKPAEEKAAAEQKAAAAAAQADREQQAKEEEAAAAAAAAAGVMTRQDAGFLLDSLKTQERKLPAAPIRVNGQPQDDNTRKTFKNW